MTTETPIFDKLAYETLFAYDAAIDALVDSYDGIEESVPDFTYDHALFAFEGFHPHWRLELDWRADAFAEAEAAMFDEPWRW